MTIHSRLLVVLAVFILFAFSCSKPTLIGSDFLEDEKANLKFQDTFGLTFFTEVTDSVVVHSVNVSKQLVTYLCGHVEDPIFGKYTAEIYAQPLLPGVASALLGSTLDSVVLQLRYDTLGFYGDTLEPVTLEVYRMAENPDFKVDYYSDDSFMILPELLGSVTFIPEPYDSLTVFHPKDTTTYAPSIRIALNTGLMSDLLLQDESVFENQDSFLNYFNGLYIKMSSGNNTMIGFNLVSATSGLTYYYDKGTSEDLEFKFIFTTGSIKTVHMEHDYTGSPVADALTEDPEEEYFYVQGMSGVTTRMHLEGLDKIGTAIINQAEIELFCTFPNGDNGGFYPPCPYMITMEKTDTSLVISDDVAIALSLTGSSSTTESFNAIFGGKLTEIMPGPSVIYRYNMNVTNQVKSIHEGIQENIIYFNPFAKGNIPNRAVIFGPNHPTYAPRLRISYTAI
jgi:hypothetical protein